MKVLILLIFCANLAATHYKEFNSKVPSELTGKMGGNCKKLDPEIAKKLKSSMIIVTDKNKETLCLGALVAIKKVIFPASFWIAKPMFIKVYCPKPPELYEYYKLAEPVTGEQRKSVQDQFILVNLKDEIKDECWAYPGLENLINAVKANSGDLVTGVGIQPDEEPILRPFLVGNVASGFFTVTKNSIDASNPTITGEPVYFGTALLGMYLGTESAGPIIPYTNVFKETMHGYAIVP